MTYKDILFNWVVDLEQKSQVEEVNNSIPVKSSLVNLPKPEDPHFYGNCENWISFKKLFKSSILDNKSISDLEILQYLQASVCGDEAKIIRGFAITVDKLKNCWDKLCSPFENKRHLALSQINKVFRVFIEREARGLNELKFVKPDIKKGPPIKGPKGTPSALPTKLGHLLSGTINTQYNQNSSLICHTLLNIDHSLKQFWELESVPKDILSKDEDELCESIFINSYIRNADGRYILKLPFRDDSSLGDSKEGALKRFYSLERKLHSNNQLKEKYTEFMEEYQNPSHMTPLASDVKSPHYFVSHRGVIIDNSSTTKLRVVFHGSFKSTNGNSLKVILRTESWHHIPDKLNPADWATRGLYPKQLLENSEWVAGPKWLHDFHPSSKSFIPFSEQPVALVPIDQSESLSDSVVL
ncbi:gag-pol protein [Trichonephila clavipes]|nr:gag-pol protein [Trichonephila clavipes]